MAESTKDFKTRDALKVLGIDRTRLTYISLALGIKPKQIIINGRVNNFYSAEQLKKIEEVLKK